MNSHRARARLSVRTITILSAGMVLGIVLSAALACGPAATSSGPPERIVLIVADTLRRDFLSPYGAKVATPNLQRLADDGVVFTNAISSFHQTTMSMSSLFTGRTPSLETGDAATSLPWTSANWCGMARLAAGAEDTCIPRSLDTLAEDMKRAGYETLGVLSNRLIFRPYGYDQGFDAWVEVGERERPETRSSRIEESKLRTAERVNASVFRTLEERQSDRFFLYVHYIDPHDYGVRPDLRTYADGVRHTDTAVGRLLDHLREKGLFEDTVVVFTSDHGEYLGGDHALPATRKHFGNPSFDSLLEVPLIISPASLLAAGASPAAGDPARLVRTQDVRGILREIAGLDATSPTDIAADEVFLTEQFYQTYRKGRWKSTFSRDGAAMALFDLEKDPGEKRDAAALHPEIVIAHKKRIAELTAALGTRKGADAELSDDDAERLRALGYLD